MRLPSLRKTMAACSAAVLLALAGCGSGDYTAASPKASAAAGTFPVTLKNAFGATVIEKKPERVATIVWSNHDAALALGVVPVGIPKQTYGDQDGDRVLSWTQKKLTELKAPTPTLFDESDGLDFEAIADTRPDVILAAYSGMSKADYTTLSEIAPTVTYPGTPFGTGWRDTIRLDAKALGLADKGDALVTGLEKTIHSAADAHPALKGRTAMVGYFAPKDFSKVGYYTSHDVRNQFSVDLGMKIPASLTELSAKTKEFYATLSAEKADVFDDVDIIVTYGDDKLLGRLQKDPLLGKIPAIARGAVVVIPQNSELAAALSPPTALTIPATTDEYAGLLADAARHLK
ncbi:iron-siderophore ABC transporter substrate-binding protein [Streptomyces nodosus]|uniref:iron-siderophore ABC transporter substrate-binding protein n=1 Tax=Streptomyces nodosus TaxID=40318 RepID=UPI0037FEAE30